MKKRLLVIGLIILIAIVLVTIVVIINRKPRIKVTKKIVNMSGIEYEENYYDIELNKKITVPYGLEFEIIEINSDGIIIKTKYGSTDDETDSILTIVKGKEIVLSNPKSYNITSNYSDAIISDYNEVTYYLKLV